MSRWEETFLYKRKKSVFKNFEFENSCDIEKTLVLQCQEILNEHAIGTMYISSRF